MMIASYQTIGPADDGTLQHRVIIGVSGDNFQIAGHGDDQGELGDFVGIPTRVCRWIVKLGNEFLGKLVEDLGAGEALASARQRNGLPRSESRAETRMLVSKTARRALMI